MKPNFNHCSLSSARVRYYTCFSTFGLPCPNLSPLASLTVLAWVLLFISENGIKAAFLIHGIVCPVHSVPYGTSGQVFPASCPPPAGGSFDWDCRIWAWAGRKGHSHGPTKPLRSVTQSVVILPRPGRKRNNSPEPTIEFYHSPVLVENGEPQNAPA